VPASNTSSTTAAIVWIDFIRSCRAFFGLYYTLHTMEATPSLRLPSSIFGALIVYGALQGYHYAARLPDILATHFGGRGQPNGWQTHSAFWATETFVIALATAIGFGVPAEQGALAGAGTPRKHYYVFPRDVRLVRLRPARISSLRKRASLPRQPDNAAPTKHDGLRRRPFRLPGFHSNLDRAPDISIF
jgi:hypothetical protein